MSDKYPTLDALVALGFEHREPEFGMKTVGYRFRYLDLKASASISMYFRPDVLLSGVLNTGRTLSQIEHHLSGDLGTPQEAAAWVSYVLKSDRSDLEPLPAWFLEGERHWDLVPAVREEQASQERLEAYRAAYQASPKCFIDREYARPLRRKLQAALSEIVGKAEMTFNFDGRVLSITLYGAVHEVVASGESWPCSYQITVSSETRLPPRFTSSTVEVNVFKDNLILAELRLGPCEVAA